VPAGPAEIQVLRAADACRCIRLARADVVADSVLVLVVVVAVAVVVVVVVVVVLVA
jgi:hypothetical protein